MFIAEPEVVLRIGISLFRREAVPLHGFGIVLVGSETEIVAVAKVALCFGKSLFRRETEPFARIRSI